MSNKEIILRILVKPKAKNEKIEKLENFGDADYKIFVKEEAKDGKANDSVIKLIKRKFKSEHVVIIKGKKSRKKLIKIINPKADME